MKLRNFILPDVLALALYVAVRRSSTVAPALPDLRRAPWWLLVALLVVSAVLAVRGIRAIDAVDHELTDAGRERSAKLEWVYSSKTADEVIEGWDREPPMRARAAEGLRLDTVAFIPFYPFALFTLMLLAARVWPPQSEPYRWATALAWAGLVAGVLDLLENAGIWLELRRGLTELAPLTATVALLKWILIGLVGCHAIAAAIAVIRAWRAGTPG